MTAIWRVTPGGGGWSGETTAPGMATPARTYCWRTTWMGHFVLSLM